MAKGRTAGGTLAFEPDDPLGVDQRRLNALFTCSWLHDFFFTLGFDEAGGNFQSKNFVRPDKAGDEMRVVISRGFGPWAAGLVAARDGTQPHMCWMPRGTTRRSRSVPSMHRLCDGERGSGSTDTIRRATSPKPLVSETCSLALVATRWSQRVQVDGQGSWPRISVKGDMWR